MRFLARQRSGLREEGNYTTSSSSGASLSTGASPSPHESTTHQREFRSALTTPSSSLPPVTLPSLTDEDIAELLWKPLDKNMSTKRQYCACATIVLETPAVLVCGGHNGQSYLSSAEVYRAGEWSPLPSPPNFFLQSLPSNKPKRPSKQVQLQRRHGCAAVSIQNKVFFIGGFSGKITQDTVHAYTFATGSSSQEGWTSLPCMNVRRSGCAAVAIGRRIFVMGGFNGTNALDSVEMYDLDTGRWNVFPSMLEKRNRCAATAIAAGGNDGAPNAIVVVGGNDGNEMLRSAEVYNLETGCWSHLSTNSIMSKPRYGCAAVTVRNHVLVMGGYDGRKSLNAVEVYNINTGLWTTSPQSLLEAREGCAATIMGNKILVVGGYNNNDGENSDLCSVEELVVERVVPKPPELPPIPSTLLLSSLSQSDKSSNQRDSVAAMEAWTDEVLSVKKRYETKVTSAISRIRRDFRESKRRIEQSIKKKQWEIQRLQTEMKKQDDRRKATIQNIQDNAETWKEDVEQQVQCVMERAHSGSTRKLAPSAPPELICCITLELMKDPVIAVADGHTYERRAIEQLFSQTAQHPRSPKTGEPMQTRQLVPNVAIRSMCRDYQKPRNQPSSLDTYNI